MKTILISTIIRDREPYIENWYNQIKRLVEVDKFNKYYLSVYENDSIDNTLNKLNSLDFSFLEDFKIQSEKLNTKKFGSVISEERVKLLAQARNKSIFDNNFLDKCSHLLVIEPDIKYEPELIIANIINLGDYDIISARSVNYGSKLYDDWATRKTENDKRWNTNDDIPYKMEEVWSTFNCVCFYNAEPIKQKITFDSFNQRLNSFDCDTVVICENFRRNGYNKIVINGSVEVFHDQ
jgi:hypothetical protein